MSSISKKPKKKAVLSENDIDALVNKGGQVADEQKRKTSTKTKKVPVQLRLSQKLLDRIDGIIDDRVVKVSRHSWFLEAIAAQIKKEENS